MPVTYRTEIPASPAYSALFDTTGWNEEYKATSEELDRANRQSWYTVSAYDGQELVAFGRVVSDGVLHAMIYDMIVEPGHQRRGIGSEVLTRLVARCRAEDIRDVQLFCARGKKEFYTRHGFVERPGDAPGMQLAAEA